MAVNRAKILGAFLVVFAALLIVTTRGSEGAASFTLSGTVTEGGCGHKCTPLPKGERISVAISDSSAVATAPVDSAGHYSVSLPVGGYFVTPGVNTGPVEIERFAPEQVQVDLNSDQTANFTYTVREPEPLGYLHLSGKLANVPVDSFTLPQGNRAHGAGRLSLTTTEIRLQPALAAGVASGKVYPRATFVAFKKGTKTKALTLVMHDAILAEERLHSASIVFALQAKEFSLDFDK